MTDEELDEHCEQVSSLFEDWLGSQNVMDTPLEELLGDAFFAGYEKAMKTENKTE